MINAPGRFCLRRFQFRLQPALSYRQQLEDQRRVELARLDAECVRLREQVHELERLREWALEVTERRARLDMDAERRRSEYLEALTQDLRLRRAELEEVERTATLKRQEVLAASQARRVLERLKEIRQEEHRKEALHEEQRLLDDLRPTPAVSGTTA